MELFQTSGVAAVNGTTLYYEIAGAGTPVLFVHGNFGDRRHWDDQFPVFAERHREVKQMRRIYHKSNCDSY